MDAAESDDRRDRMALILPRQRVYRRLLAVCLALLVGFSLPHPWSRLISIGYLLLGIVLIRGLGWPAARLPAGRLPRGLFRATGVAALVVWVLWSLTPLHLRTSGIPVIVLWTLFSGWSAIRLIRLLALERRVTAAVLQGAVAGYLMLGVSAALLLCALETILPGSFSNVALQPPDSTADLPVWGLNFVRLNYFAFVSLTTTGYGDVIPQTPLAQMVSVSIALVGTFYVAAVMGVLISRLTVQESREPDEPPSP
jgi:voltage-gated potassium channel Kch